MILACISITMISLYKNDEVFVISIVTDVIVTSLKHCAGSVN